MSAMRCALVWLLPVMCSALLVGCHSAGTVPPGWEGTPIVDKSAQASVQPANTNIADHDTPPTGRLQVVICYGRVLSNHTVVRLEAPGAETLFWDPGGTYRLYDPEASRHYDVITRDAPTIEQWWRYRWDICSEPVMEVFEWSLDADQAHRLHTILLTRHDPEDRMQVFEPDAGGLECCLRTCEFLDRFAEGKPAVPARYFWPHELGQHLWTQSPDRVMVYRKDGESMIYRRASE